MDVICLSNCCGAQAHIEVKTLHVSRSALKKAWWILSISVMTSICNPISKPSPPTMEDKEVRPPSPNIILRCDNDFLSSQKSAWDSSSDGEGEAEVQKVPDVCRDDLASRRTPRGPMFPRVHQFVPSPLCSDKDRERWEGIRRASQQTLQEKEIRLDVFECVIL